MTLFKGEQKVQITKIVKGEFLEWIFNKNVILNMYICRKCI